MSLLRTEPQTRSVSFPDFGQKIVKRRGPPPDHDFGDADGDCNPRSGAAKTGARFHISVDRTEQGFRLACTHHEQQILTGWVEMGQHNN
jgi:hypothetical protein